MPATRSGTVKMNGYVLLKKKNLLVFLIVSLFNYGSKPQSTAPLKRAAPISVEVWLNAMQKVVKDESGNRSRFQ